MAQVDKYRAYIKDLLTQYSRHKSPYGDDETYVIFDTERDHYQLVHAGWHNNRRMYGCIVHMDIKNGKIWIQHDGTEIGMANELVTLGVPKEDIVLAFQSPSKRPYTGFAVN
jgi:hypothetical protein